MCTGQRWARVSVDLCVPACVYSSIFPWHSRVPVQHFFAFPCALTFLFRVTMLLYQRVYVWGVGVRLITRALCVHGRIRRAGSTRHLAITPPRHACAVYEYTGRKPVWGETKEYKLVIEGSVPPIEKVQQES